MLVLKGTLPGRYPGTSFTEATRVRRKIWLMMLVGAAIGAIIGYLEGNVSVGILYGILGGAIAGAYLDRRVQGRPPVG
jgi:membrane associated rhomboid family serine protease